MRGPLVALALVTLVPASGRAADVVVTYLVEQPALRGLAADTPLAFELHGDAACSTAMHVATVPAGGLALIERVRAVRVRGAGAVPRVARLHQVLTGAPDATAYFLRVTGPGVVPVGGECQPQLASQDRAGNLPCASQVGNEVYFDGCNLNIRNGLGATYLANGVGNLVIGYNEGYDPPPDRSGSHNLVIGSEHTYSAMAGLVAGEHNSIADQATAALGTRNAAGGYATIVSGGLWNVADGVGAVVSGGFGNDVNGFGATVSGGEQNIAGGEGATVSGGYMNQALADFAAVSGGSQNQALNFAASVSGGDGNVASGDGATVAAGERNTASGILASVSGGVYNTAGGIYASVGGGSCNGAGSAPVIACGISPHGAAAIVGGYRNLARGSASVVAGGNDNTASGDFSAVSGGEGRSAPDASDWAAGSLLEDF